MSALPIPSADTSCPVLVAQREEEAYIFQYSGILDKHVSLCVYAYMHSVSRRGRITVEVVQLVSV